MNLKNNKFKITSCLLVAGLIMAIPSIAQRDTSRQSIDITSSYKPVLRNAVKINFSGSQLRVDTTRPSLTYKIPEQNLFYAYQPVSLKPLALQQDTSLYLGDRRYVKAGFGSYSSPYLEAGVSLGDGNKSLLNFYGDYISAKGDIKHQDFSQLKVKATGSYFAASHEFYGSATVKSDQYNLYGYDHSLFEYEKDDVKLNYQDITVKAGLKNTEVNDLGLNYDPSVEVNFFTNVDRVSESTIRLHIPANKKFGEDFTFKADFLGEFTNYQTKNIFPDDYSFGNNLLHLAPAVVYSKPLFTIHGGIKPTWNDGEFKLLPDIYFEARLQNQPFMLQGGWIGRYAKNTYRNLVSVNPYILPLTNQVNTRELEFFGGLKGSLGKHFNFSARAGFINYENAPLYINDTASADPKAFKVMHETNMNNLRIQGDISYINQDKFTFNAGLTLNGFTGMEVHERAWNTVPMEFRSSLRWWAFKHLMIKGDLFIFGGGNSLGKNNATIPFSGGADLSAGLEYKINKNFSAWINGNNLLNDKYERWKNYEVYGINLMGGILVHF